jgi:hypothetical protein
MPRYALATSQLHRSALHDKLKCIGHRNDKLKVYRTFATSQFLTTFYPLFTTTESEQAYALFDLPQSLQRLI